MRMVGKSQCLIPSPHWIQQPVFDSVATDLMISENDWCHTVRLKVTNSGLFLSFADSLTWKIISDKKERKVKAHNWEPPNNTPTTKTIAISNVCRKIGTTCNHRVPLCCPKTWEAGLVSIQDETERVSTRGDLWLQWGTSRWRTWAQVTIHLYIPEGICRPGFIENANRWMTIALENLLCIPVKVLCQLWWLNQICCPVPEWAVIYIIIQLFALVHYRRCSYVELGQMSLSQRQSTPELTGDSFMDVHCTAVCTCEKFLRVTFLLPAWHKSNTFSSLSTSSLPKAPFRMTSKMMKSSHVKNPTTVFCRSTWASLQHLNRVRTSACLI